MSKEGIRYAVFTKPWKMPLPELAQLVRKMGYEGIELPVRPGYQVEPETVRQGLPEAARILGDHGVKITSISGPTDEVTFAACAEAGIPFNRVMAYIGEVPYMQREAELIREYSDLVPLLERYNVKLAVQNHCDRFVANAMGLRHLLERLDTRYICAVWDAAHNALNGEEPELGLDIVWEFVGMIFFKNAYWQRVSGPEAVDVAWRPYWTSARQGLASWPRVAAELKRRNYRGVVCITAEYTDEASVNRLTAEDLQYLKELLLS